MGEMANISLAHANPDTDALALDQIRRRQDPQTPIGPLSKTFIGGNEIPPVAKDKN